MEQSHLGEMSLHSEDTYSLVQKLKQNILLYNRYQSLNQEWRQRFLEYCTGKKTLPVTYDPFFKRIFHPDVHPERLSRLISSLLEVPVRVVKILPSEESMLDGGVLLIMDILVELEDGALANVEVQKVPYLFAGERVSCYSSDLVLRQYSRVKGEKGSCFKYGDLKKVYTIVIFERSTDIFHGKGMHYLHRGRTVFDTGLQLELLQEYCLVALDVFREKPYAKDRTEQTAWIAFLATDSLRQAEELALEHPWLEEIYAEMTEYLHKPEEVLNMFSEALKIMDQNTVQYMIELQQQKLDEAQERLGETEGRLSETQGRLSEAQEKLGETQERLGETEGRLSEAQGRLSETQEKLGETQERLGETQKELAEVRSQLAQSTEKAMADTVSFCREMGIDRGTVICKLQESYRLSAEEAERIVGECWQ